MCIRDSFASVLSHEFQKPFFHLCCRCSGKSYNQNRSCLLYTSWIRSRVSSSSSGFILSEKEWDSKNTCVNMHLSLIHIFLSEEEKFSILREMTEKYGQEMAQEMCIRDRHSRAGFGSCKGNRFSGHDQSISRRRWKRNACSRK